MLSVLFCSRVKDNPASNLPKLLDSAVEHIRPEERDKIEFLIKYDDDDDRRPVHPGAAAEVRGPDRAERGAVEAGLAGARRAAQRGS